MVNNPAAGQVEPPAHSPSLWTSRAGLLAVFGLALILRLWGSAWGLPDRLDLHPDEHDYVLKYALKLSWDRPDPGFLNYPGFIYYLISLTFGGLCRLGLLDGQPWQAYAIGRIWSALFSAATVIPVFALARAFGGTIRGALLSSLFVALLPLSVWEAHFAVTDSLMTFWTMMTLWGSVRLMHSDKGRDYVFVGLYLGLATGSKYTAAIACVAILTGTLLSRQPLSRRGIGLLVAALVAVASAFIVTPFSFLRLPDVLKAMTYEHAHTQSHHFGFSLPANGPQYHRYLYQLVCAWPFSLGFALYFAAVAGALWLVIRRTRQIAPVLAFGLVFFGVTGSWSFVPLRYYLPLVTIGALSAGLGLTALLEHPRARTLGLLFLAGTLGYTTIFVVQTTERFTDETRMLAGRWIDQNLPDGTTVYYCGWARYMGLPEDLDRIKIKAKDQEGILYHPERLNPGDILQITSMQYARQYRQGNEYFTNMYNRIRKPGGDFELLSRFDTQFINKQIYMQLDPMFGGYFVGPNVEFYRYRPVEHKPDKGTAKS